MGTLSIFPSVSEEYGTEQRKYVYMKEHTQLMLQSHRHRPSDNAIPISIHFTEDYFHFTRYSLSI